MKKRIFFPAMAVATFVLTLPVDAATATNKENRITANQQYAAQAPANDFNVKLNDLSLEERKAVKACINQIKKWNQGLNTHNVQNLSSLYTSISDFYGTACERSVIAEKHRNMMKKMPAYKQAINNVKVTVYNGARILIEFDKYVQAQPGEEFKKYHAYMSFSGYETTWNINRESDTTTDANLAKRQKNRQEVNITNNTALSSIFNINNVGKQINADYWVLVMSSADGETEGPLAKAMSKAGTISLRMFMNGELKKNYRGQANTLYVDGITEAGEAEFIVIWVYNLGTGKLTCIEE